MDLCLIAATAAGAEEYVGMALSIAMVAIGLGFVIFVHELGHFLAAKACGVKAEKFYIGFDIPMPKILGWQVPSTIAKFQWGETEYGIGILPLGGYVKMLGQDDDPRKYKDEQARAKNEPTAGAVMTPVEPIPDKPVFDQRSYQAKSVPQRMLIISAGVIMNLIFGVLMAALAYGMGMPYTPTVIGHAPAGSPGWVKDLRPGDHIIRVGANGHQSKHLRFQQDLLPQILLANGDEVELLVKRDDSEPFTVAVRGVKRPGLDFALLGISSCPTTVVRSLPEIDRLAAAKVKDLRPGDVIVAVNGTRLADGDPKNPECYVRLQEMLAQHPSETLNLTVERTERNEEGAPVGDPTTHELKLPPQPMRTLGMQMKMGPVSAVRKNSPAESAGILPGDEIISINGEPIGEPLTLSQRLLELVGQENVDIEISRTGSDKKKQTLSRKITPAAPIYMEDGADGLGGDQVGLEPLGIAAPLGFTVVEVGEGGPAAKAGIAAGDEVVGVQFTTDDELDREKLSDRLKEQITLEPESINWLTVMGLLQELPESINVEVTFRHDNKLVSKTVTPVDSTEGHFEPRGLMLNQLERTRTAESAGEALALGFRETKDKLKEIADTLRGLVTGRVSPKNLGSPIMIAQVAYNEASKGWASLLIFLTFLSANLALVNFLPIPVLDGGHMVFLAAEGIRGKPVDEHVQYYALLVGAAMLLCLMVFVFSNDIMRLIG